MANPTVLIPLAQGCEELEAVTIIDLLRRAGISVTSAGLDAQPVKASRGTVLIPDTTLDQVLLQDFDMIVLPGGQPGADHLRDDPRIQQKLKQQAAQNKFVAAILPSSRPPRARWRKPVCLMASAPRVFPAVSKVAPRRM